ncbi:MAG: class I SAM-dependent methyltransferase [Acidobacteria bacterium]|nr:class I SAM-dependent methyltransferase [Acidobacteriota bacterium]
MSNSSLGLSEALQQYLLDVSLHEPAVCRRLREQTLLMSEAKMLSSPEQVQLLLLMLKMLDAKTAIEVGTFTGYTSLRLTLGIPELRMTCCDTSEEFTTIAETYWREAGVAERVELRLAPALETLDELIANGKSATFDFAYVDADKTEYREYVERCLTLVRPGGLIAIDNTLWSGSVADPENHEADTLALRRLNSWLYSQEDYEYDLSLVPIGDGLTLLRVGLST